MEIKEEKFRVLVKPNSKTNEIVGFDSNRKAYKMNIKEAAQDGKANTELVKFLSKKLNKVVQIKSGHKSREKVIEVRFK